MTPPQTSHVPYSPVSNRCKARSISAIDAAIDLAAAVVASLSTASVVPSPTLLPNETEAVSDGGAVRRSRSTVNVARRSSRKLFTWSGLTPSE